jgi:hypothetical protein
MTITSTASAATLLVKFLVAIISQQQMLQLLEDVSFTTERKIFIHYNFQTLGAEKLVTKM